MRTLLLADESITVQRVIALTFADEPFRVVAVSDGQQAMERMAAQKPDIVLAGTTLPQIDGYDLAKYVKSKPELKHVPVLLLSGAFEAVDEARLASSGANGVIEKPVEPIAVISRVKELLGLKSTATPAPAAGRLITSVQPPPFDKAKLPTPTPPRAVISTMGTPSRWQQLRDQSLEPDARPVESRDDYMDSLGAAFDSLDQQLAGRGPTNHPNNPSPPLGQQRPQGDPRSPGRQPQAVAPPPGQPVYEVDDDWFANESKTREDARAGRREIMAELSAPEPQVSAPPAPPPQQVFEVDDEWFKEDEQARAAKIVQQRQLAAEMGIHEVDVPEVEPRPDSSAPVVDLDCDLGIDELQPNAPPVVAAAEPPMAAAPEPLVVAAPAPVAAIPRPTLAPLPPRPIAPAPRPAADPPEAPPPAAVRSPAPAPIPSPVAVRPMPAPEAISPVTPPVPRLVQPPPPVEAPTPIVAAAPVVPVTPSEPAPVAPVALAALDATDRPFATEPVARPLPELFDFAGTYARRSAPAPTPPPVAPLGVPMLPPIVAANLDLPRQPVGRDVADDFAALLAFERGENARPPMVEPIVHTVTPEITGEMLDQIGTVVADRLAQSVRVEPVAPPITAEMLDQIGTVVADRLTHTIRVEPVAPPITAEMLDQIGTVVADRLTHTIRVEPVAPQITDDMLDQITTRVADRLNTGLFGNQLREAMTDTVRETVRTVVSETSERLVRDEIERIKSKG